MAYCCVTYYLCIGFIILLLFIYEVEPRRYSSGRYHGSGTSSLDSEERAILLGTIGGVIFISLLLYCLYLFGAFKRCTDCCQDKSSLPKKTLALMYNPTPGPDGKKIHPVIKTKASKVTPLYGPGSDMVYTGGYPLPPAPAPAIYSAPNKDTIHHNFPHKKLTRSISDVTSGKRRKRSI